MLILISCADGSEVASEDEVDFTVVEIVEAVPLDDGGTSVDDVSEKDEEVVVSGKGSDVPANNRAYVHKRL